MSLIIGLAIVGIILILAELVLPGGILGVFGIICMLAAVVLTYQYGALQGTLALLGLLVFGLVTFGLWAKLFHRLPFTRNLVLNKAIDDNTEDLRLEALAGKEGITLTVLSPSGYAEIDGEKIDVMSETGKIEKDIPIKIVEIRGPSIIVEQV